MSSETLNFGPQWLRELSSGQAKSSSEPSPSNLFPPASKFKLAEYRYGREEMLALFVKENEIPEELFSIPLLISEEPQLPLALMPAEDVSLTLQQNGYRGRGISSGNVRPRPMPSRGIGRNRGASWDQNEDFFSHRPLIRRAESEDWRGKYVNGKGDGDGLVEKDLSRKDWRNVPRKEVWKENNSVFQDAPEEMPEIIEKGIEQITEENQSISPTVLRDSEENLNTAGGNIETPNEDVADNSNCSNQQGMGQDRGMNNIKGNTLQVDSRLDTPSTVMTMSQPLLSDNMSTQSEKPFSASSLSSNWFYKDPQGVTQGPFSSSQMMEWFNAGYFTLVLLVRRACDETFTPLGQLIKMYSYVPFQEVPTKQNELSKIGNESSTQEYQSFLHHDTLKWSFPSARQGLDRSISLQERFMQDSMPMPSNSPMQDEDIIRALQKKKLEEARIQKMLHEQSYEKLLRDQNTLLYLNQKEREEMNRQEILLQKQREWEHFEKQKLLAEQLAEKERLEKIEKQKEEEKQNAFKEMMRIQREKEEIEKQEQLRQKQQMEEMERQEKIKKNLEEKRKEEIEQERKRKFLEEQQQREKLKEEERMKKIIEEQEKREKLEEMERMRIILEEQKQKVEREKQEKINEMLRKEEETKRREQEILQKQRNEELARQVELEQKLKNEAERTKQEQTNEESILKQEEGEWKKYENAAKAQRGVMDKSKKKKGASKAEESKKSNNAESPNVKKNNKVAKQRSSTSVIDSSSVKKFPKKSQEKEVQLQKSKEITQPVEAILPPSVQWVTKGTENLAISLPSLMEIQTEEQANETRLREEEAKMEQNKKKKQPTKKSGWGFAQTTPETKSLLEIQKEEKRQIALAIEKEKSNPQPKVLDVVKDSLWSKPPKIQPDPLPTKKSNFWDQVMEENTPEPKPAPVPKSSRQQQKSKSSSKSIKNEEKVKSLFQPPPSVQNSAFLQWCEVYLKGMNTGHLDIPTFVSFMVDVQSPSEVEEYVQSYLGDSRDAKEFLRLFLEKRKKTSNTTSFTSQSSPASEFEGFELVSGNSKRSKKKQKKSQKLDPRLLGFSVNAASDRVNMGEIETSND